MPEIYGNPTSADDWELDKTIEENTNAEGKFLDDNSLTASEQLQADLQSIRDDLSSDKNDDNTELKVESVENENNENGESEGEGR
jgi:hypothetical protein